MNGMQREIEGSVFIFPMILRIRTVRPERLNWLNSVMPRQISVQLSSTIRLDMILRIKNHSFMKPILEVLTTYHGFHPCPHTIPVSTFPWKWCCLASGGSSPAQWGVPSGNTPVPLMSAPSMP